MGKLDRYDSPDWDDLPLFRSLWTINRHWMNAACRIRFTGRDGVPRDGGLIVAANHFSWWDPILVHAVFPRPVSWIAKRELFASRFNSWFFHAVGCIPVDRQSKSGNAEAMRAAVDAIARGRVIGIFPEGTRSTPGHLLPPKTGVARVAALSGAPVLPVGVLSDRFWGKGRSTPNFGEAVRVRIGEPVRYDYGPEAAGDKDVLQKIADDVMHRVATLVDEAWRERERDEAR